MTPFEFCVVTQFYLVVRAMSTFCLNKFAKLIIRYLLISFKSKIAPSTVVKCLKGHSAKVFFANHPEIKNSKFWGGHLWSHSYYMSTLDNMSKSVVEQYVRSQYATAEEKKKAKSSPG